MNSNNKNKEEEEEEKQQVQQQKQQHTEEGGSKPIKNQASQIIRRRRIATDSWLERIDGCCIPDVKWQCVPNRRPKRENVQSPPVLPLQDGSGRRRVPTLKWRDREGEHSCRRSERQTGVGEVNSVETEACKFRNFERRRASSGAVRVSVWCIQLWRCTDYKLSCNFWTLKCTTVEMRKIGQGWNHQCIMPTPPRPWNNVKVLKSGLNILQLSGGRHCVKKNLTYAS